MVSSWIDVRPTPSPFILSLALARARERSRRGLVRRSDGLHIAVACRRRAGSHVPRPFPSGVTAGALHPGDAHAARRSRRGTRCNMACCRGRFANRPYNGCAGCAAMVAVRRTRLHAAHVGATRCVALVRSCTTAPHHPGCPPTTAPTGDPPGRPYMAHRRAPRAG